VTPPEIILASASPRRRELLQKLGVRFEVVTAAVQELDAHSSPHLNPTDLAREYARIKAKAVAEQKPCRWVLGADTVVALESRLLGKPESLDQAHEFLQALSGRTHDVVTGCALVDPEGREEVFHDVSRVTFLALSAETMARYLAEVNVLDKAGGYAVQERPEWIIDRVEGSRTNVIGLPTELIESVFRRNGLL